MNDTLAERGARYGAFINHAEIAQGLQAVLHKMPNWPTLDYDMRQALVVITDKIARIGNGDPFYDDNWHDIQGYAKLVEDRIKAIPQTESQLFEAVDDAIMPELKVEDLQVLEPVSEVIRNYNPNNEELLYVSPVGNYSNVYDNHY